MRAQRLIRRDFVEQLDAPESLVQVAVAVDDDEVVGTIAFTPTDRPEVWVIVSLGVAIARQRTGIGTALKTWALERCREMGVHEVISTVHRRNTPMNSLNTKLGVASDKDPDDGDYLLTVAKLTPS